MTLYFFFSDRLTQWSGADNGLILRCFYKIISLMEFCRMLHISVLLCADILRSSSTLLCPNKYLLILRISVTIYISVTSPLLWRVCRVAKATVCFVMSVRLPARNNLAPTGRNSDFFFLSGAAAERGPWPPYS